MTQLLDWITQYSPTIVALMAFGAALLFLIRLVVEKGIDSAFNAKTMQFETIFKRRSAFEEKVLADRFSLTVGLSSRLERVMTNLNRMSSGQPAPDGFMRQDEIVPLTEIFEDLAIHRLVLGEDFYQLFSKQAAAVLGAARVSTPKEWDQKAEEWAGLRETVRMAAEAAFGISEIHW